MAARLSLRLVAAAAAAGLILAGCAGAADDQAGPGDETATPPGSTASPLDDVLVDPTPTAGPDEVEPASVPLRPGERRRTLRMPRPYTPSAPYGEGTDDYRCFLLDPRLEKTRWITGLDIDPGDDEVVHHVILFRVPPDQVAAAEAKDAEEPGQGWTCFSGTGVSGGGSLDNMPWLGAWAPGGTERVMPRDLGVPLERGSRVIMQVHYNLLAGTQPDRSATRLRLASGAGREALETMLLPAPVELPCRLDADGELCDREAALADVMERFGPGSGQIANGLHLLCGAGPIGPVQSCTRTIEAPLTVRAVAGHMHLLGREIDIVANAGTQRERTLLDIPVWDFDDQGSRPVPAYRMRRGDTLTVTCRHDQGLRDLLPSFAEQEERYVVWGEGTTDEMCLGLVLVTRP